MFKDERTLNRIIFFSILALLFSSTNATSGSTLQNDTPAKVDGRTQAMELLERDAVALVAAKAELATIESDPGSMSPPKGETHNRPSIGARAEILRKLIVANAQEIAVTVKKLGGTLDPGSTIYASLQTRMMAEIIFKQNPIVSGANSRQQYAQDIARQCMQTLQAELKKK